MLSALNVNTCIDRCGADLDDRAARPEGRQARRGPEVGQVPMRRHRAVGCIAPVTQRCVVGACCVLASRGRVSNPFAMPDAEPQLLTLDIPGIGSLTVIWAPEDRSWFWTVYTAQGRMLQSGMNLLVIGKNTPKRAMHVLVMFLLATADHPLADFSEVTTAWAAANRVLLASLPARRERRTEDPHNHRLTG
jgi:hypothetical protein